MFGHLQVVCILFNVTLMASEQYPQTEREQTLYWRGYFACTVIFTFEGFFKMSGTSVRRVSRREAAPQPTAGGFARTVPHRLRSPIYSWASSWAIGRFFIVRTRRVFGAIFTSLQKSPHRPHVPAGQLDS